MTELDLTQREEATHDLYASLWPDFEEDLFDQSIDLFATRLTANNFDMAWFKGKICLDAGCGGGRYSVAMAELGAADVIGVDIGKEGLDLAAKRAQARGLDNVAFQNASILDLPFEDNTFDFVCNNGVLMITEDPDKGLGELHRVLKPGGMLFIYVFGSGGVFWQMTDVARTLLHEQVPLAFARDVLRLCGVPANRRFNFLDLSYAPIHNRYSEVEMDAWLERRGFTGIRRLVGGVDYDTDSKIAADPEKGHLVFGEGDLRFLATKA